jgi:Cdc6-like AAA superfamily ATPase
MGLLTYNPQRDDADRLDRLTCGESRQALLDQLTLSLRSEIGRENHQHHLLIGPRGSGKTHTLRVLTGSRLEHDSELREAYFPIVLPEETPLRSPADLLLKVIERLVLLLEQQASDGRRGR